MLKIVYCIVIVVIIGSCNSPKEKGTTIGDAVGIKSTEVKDLKTQERVTNKTSYDLSQIYESKSYSLKYPPGWELLVISQYAEAIILSDKVTPNQRFEKNINIQISDRDDKANLDQMVDKFTKQIMQFSKTAVILESKHLEKNGLEYHQLIYVSDAIQNTKNINQYWVKDDKGYFLSYTDSVEGFESSKELGFAILQSFIIK